MTAYDSAMGQSAAVMVLDHVPDEDELEEYAFAQLEELDDETAEAVVDLRKEAPDWMTLSEQDQINAHMRDGSACVLVIYITFAGEYDDE